MGGRSISDVLGLRQGIARVGMVLVSPRGIPESPGMDQFFKELGRTVLARWKAQNFSHELFPEIATQALEENPPAEHIELDALIRQFLLDDDQPFQSQSPFGQPELIVYDDPRFYIQVLFWMEGTTDIHQHSFSGAFHVMQGSSLHSMFEFQDAKSISSHFRVGDLVLKETQLLETGRTVPIVSGPGYVHSLFHLDTPSVSVVVRTQNDPGAGAQYTYLPPHLAVDPFFSDTLTNRRKELLDVLEQVGDETYADLVLEMVGKLDFERGFYILQNGMVHLQNLGAWDEVWAAFADKHGELAHYIEATLNEIIWRDGPLGYRSASTDVEHRFFLALLLNVPTRADVLQLTEQRFPEAIDTILRWSEELSEESDIGTWILDAEFPIEVKVARSKQRELFYKALRYFLEGGQGATKLTKVSAEDVEHLRAAFVRSSLRALVL